MDEWALAGSLLFSDNWTSLCRSVTRWWLIKNNLLRGLHQGYRGRTQASGWCSVGLSVREIVKRWGVTGEKKVGGGFGGFWFLSVGRTWVQGTSWTLNWNMSAIVGHTLQFVFVLIVCKPGTNDTRQGVLFAQHEGSRSVHFSQHKTTSCRKCRHEENTSKKTSSLHVFTALPDQTMLPWLSGTVLHSRITAECQQQLPGSAAVQLTCWTES